MFNQHLPYSHMAISYGYFLLQVWDIRRSLPHRSANRDPGLPEKKCWPMGPKPSWDVATARRREFPERRRNSSNEGAPGLRLVGGTHGFSHLRLAQGPSTAPLFVAPGSYRVSFALSGMVPCNCTVVWLGIQSRFDAH